MIFCLNSGGCGSKYIVKLLIRNGVQNAHHEAKPDLNKLGIEHYLKKANTEKIVDVLRDTRKEVFFESSNRLFSMANEISRAIADAKFIHLHRDGRESVRSIYSNPKITSILMSNFRFAALCSIEDPKPLSDLEKVCLYWSNVNDRILEDLRGSDYLSLKMIDLVEGRIDRLQEFIGLELRKKIIDPVNEKVAHIERKPDFTDWNTSDQDIFWRICGKTMLRLGYV